MGHTLVGRTSATLETFGGVIDLALPTDVPEGASPRNQNVDFAVASVSSRPGLQNLFAYGGNNVAHTGNVATDLGSTAIWANPGGILLDGTSGAQVTLPVSLSSLPTVTGTSTTGWSNPGDATSNLGYASCPGFTSNILNLTTAALPAGAQVTGMQIIFRAYCTASGGGSLSLGFFPAKKFQIIGNLPNTYLLGSATDLWGQTGAFFANGFTLPIAPAVTGGGSGTTFLNGAAIFVYYQVGISDELQVTQFGFSIAPTQQIIGVQVELKGQTNTRGQSAIVQLTSAGVSLGTTRSVLLQGSLQPAFLGGSTDTWGASLTAPLINATTFGIRITISGAGSANLTFAQVTVYFASVQTNYDFVGTYEDSFGNIKTVALDALGDFWVEDVTNSPGTLVPLSSIEGVPANSYVSAQNINSRYYMAISDLRQGVYPPQQYTDLPSWSDRVSQVGPGAPPNFQATLTSSGTAPITAYSYSAGILTLTAANSFTAGEVVIIVAPGGDPLAPISGQAFNVLGTGLSGTQFEIAETAVTGSGASTATATAQYTYPIVASPNGITQIASQPTVQTGFDSILWSAGPGSSSAGNVITIYYAEQNLFPNGQDAALTQAFQQGLYPVYVYVSGTNLAQANGTWLVTGVGIGTPPGASAKRYFFTYSIAQTGNQQLGGGANSQPGRYQMTIATLTTALPLPGVQVGDQVTLSGNGVSAWNATWSILVALNSGTYSISQTAMTAGVATYTWQLQGATSSPPVTGQLVTVTGCLNGNVNGISVFNVTDAEISGVTGTTSGTFTVGGFAQNLNFSAQAETAQAQTSGTKFLIDPGPLAVGSNSANPIYGNSGGGYITIIGSTVVTIQPGTRRGVVFFITRNGYYTKPSPYLQFTVTQNSNYILVSNIPVGPPEVIARGLAFTEAGQNDAPGASYYTLPNPVQFVYNGVTYTSSSLFINDNTTTTAKVTFTDFALLEGEEIDIQGNDLFNMIELGDAAWCGHYAQRSVWGRVRTQVPNFVNMSFDGGYNPNPGGAIAPLGWSIVAGSAGLAGSTLLNSPIYGNSYYIQNTTGITQAVLGQIYQSAYQDQSLISIIQPNTTYSVRVTVRTPSSATAGSLYIFLQRYDPVNGFGQVYGQYILPCSSMTSSMATYSGTLLTIPFTGQIPSDLVLAVYAEALPNNGDIEIDRITVYPTIQPTDLSGVYLSYRDNPEAIDGVTARIATDNVNQQPANGAFLMHGRYYILKENSMGFISDSPNQEPSNWNPYEEVSNVAGACGIFAYDFGEEWAIMANQSGLFAFNGGAPTPIQLEVPALWGSINWSAAQCMVVRNDFPNRRIYIACPMSTPNQFLPLEPVNVNPTANNVVIMLNWMGIPTIEGLMTSEGMHVTIMGKLTTLDMRRKYSPWTIATPYMGFIKRSELFSEMAFCAGDQSSQISTLGSITLGADNGVPFLSTYMTYGFVDSKKAESNPMFGFWNKRFVLWDLLLNGNGNLTCKFFQNTPSAPYPFTVPGGINLIPVAPNDYLGKLDVYGMRLFVQLSSFGAGNWFQLSRVSLIGRQDSWNPLGVNQVMAGV